MGVVRKPAGGSVESDASDISVISIDSMVDVFRQWYKIGSLPYKTAKFEVHLWLGEALMAL